jgi:hypothetical protein
MYREFLQPKLNQSHFREVYDLFDLASMNVNAGPKFGPSHRRGKKIREAREQIVAET